MQEEIERYTNKASKWTEVITDELEIKEMVEDAYNSLDKEIIKTQTKERIYQDLSDKLSIGIKEIEVILESK
jgi:sugar-specific transcriptional regulator TrmB